MPALKHGAEPLVRDAEEACGVRYAAFGGFKRKLDEITLQVPNFLLERASFPGSGQAGHAY